MKEKFYLRLGLAALCLGVVASSALARPEPNAFLNRPAKSTAQLVQQVRSDREVMDRYRRHFGRNDAEVVQMLSDLRLSKLNEEGTYMVYSVEERTGVIRATPQRLKAGTLVFADAAGNPVLKANCGNAMVPGSDLLMTSVNPAMPQMSENQREVAVSIPDNSEMATYNPGASVPGEPIALAPAAPQITTGSSNQGFALPAALAALGGAGAFLLGTGGSAAPVPEPASMVVMVGAVAAYVARRRSTKK